MKVLNLSSNDEIGGRFNGFEIHYDLEKRGIFSTLGCFWSQNSDKKWVFNPFPGALTRFFATLIRTLESSAGYQNKFQFWSKSLLRHPLFTSSDVVHLQIIHDHWINTKTVQRIANEKPTVWTWHDFWPVTGHCIFPGDCSNWLSGCGNCPSLSSPLPVIYDRTSQNLLSKLKDLGEMNVSIHVTTSWMRKKIEKILGPNSKLDIVTFPFGVDPEVFQMGDRSSIRDSLGLSPDDFVVFARATDDSRKGFIELVRVLESLAETYPNLVLLTVQDTKLAPEMSKQLRILQFEWTSTPLEIVALYTACDIFAMPSKAESFGMMALEAMSCSRPVITVKNTATAEVVGCSELEVGQFDLEGELLRVLNSCLRGEIDLGALGNKSRNRATSDFSYERYLDNLASLYQRKLEEK